MGNLKFSILASGSKGNACYLQTDKARILIDAGLSCRDICGRLEHLQIQPKILDAIVITHEHSDHIRGAGPLARRFGVPVYLTQLTLEKAHKKLGNLPKTVFFNSGDDFRIHDITIQSFTKCHDAVDPIGLTFSCNGIKIGIATDLGKSTRLVEDHLKNCHALILESNYDPEMLERGPYPPELKRRIKSRDGHLSNRQAGDLLKTVMHDALELIVLAHLSEINNSYETARDETESIMKQNDHLHTKILIGEQYKPIPLIEL